MASRDRPPYFLVVGFLAADERWQHEPWVNEDTNDTAWHTLVATWRPRRVELYLDGISRASSSAANTATSDAFGIYRWGWGFSTNQDFNGDIALILCCGACWTGHMVRRWHADPFGFLRPWNEVPALMGSAPPATPPSTATGVVTFLMG